MVNDTFGGMSVYGANAYVLLKREDKPVNIWTRTFNILLYEIR